MGAHFGESVSGGVRYALLAVLGLVGLDTLAHGFYKLIGGPAVWGGGVIEGLGLPFPILFGAVIMVIELIGGILLLVVLAWEATAPRRSSPWGG
jgi:uncharacterized membrane protein YphA (DoxX/SURF4 family)